MSKAPLWSALKSGPEYWTLSGPNVGMIQILNKAGDKTIATYTFAQSADLKKRLEDLLKEFIVPGQQVPVKIVVDKLLADELQAVVANMGFDILKLVERSGKFEIRYYPQLYRMQVSVPATTSVNIAEKNHFKILLVGANLAACSILSKIFSTDPEIDVVGGVTSCSQMKEAILKCKPDAMIIDLHLPEISGAAALKQYLSKYDIPAIVVSSQGINDGTAVMNALDAGAMDYIRMPSSGDIAETSHTIIMRVKAVIKAELQHKQEQLAGIVKANVNIAEINQNRLVVIGASTGGTKALREVFLRLPKEIPPIVVVQHIPKDFSKAFADYLNQICPFEVKEGAEGDEVKPGRAIIAPGGKHVKVLKRGGRTSLLVEDSAPVNRHKPSVDVLFNSAVENFGPEVLGVLLTGMGADGAKGLRALKDKGCLTIAQDEKSCVVFGMPQAAIKMGGAVKVVSLKDIAQVLMDELTGKAGQKKAG